MWEKRKCNPIKRKTMVCFVIFMTALASVTPALANYLGPNRTVTETSTICKINLYECQYVPTRDMYRYKVVDGWACADESKAWKVYPNQPDGRGCFDVTSGD